jgi:hypothetical protein
MKLKIDQNLLVDDAVKPSNKPNYTTPHYISP